MRAEIMRSRRDEVVSSLMHEAFIKQSIELAREARRAGNHPFGALLVLDGQVVLTASNTIGTDRDPTAHAETNLVAEAIRRLTADQIRRSVLYTSCEPCAMCVGKMYWAGIRSVVYALPAGELALLAGRDFLIPCRQLFARALEPVTITGPLLLAEAREVHLGFWSSSSTVQALPSEMRTLLVRPEQSGDEHAITRVHDAAFGQTDESRIVDAIRRAGHSNISFVALDGSGIVGHIFFSPVAIEASQPVSSVMGLGPMAVLPEMQRRGIGSWLVREGLQECARSGCRAVVVVGHPQYYPRFGFRTASSFGLRCEYPVPDEVFMAIELEAGALAGGGGLVRYLPEFGGA